MAHDNGSSFKWHLLLIVVVTGLIVVWLEMKPQFDPYLAELPPWTAPAALGVAVLAIVGFVASSGGAPSKLPEGVGKIEMELQRNGGGTMGLELGMASNCSILQVKSITPSGLVAAYNAEAGACGKPCVMVHDLLVSVNGVNNANGIISQLQGAQVLKIVLGRQGVSNGDVPNGEAKDGKPATNGSANGSGNGSANGNPAKDALLPPSGPKPPTMTPMVAGGASSKAAASPATSKSGSGKVQNLLGEMAQLRAQMEASASSAVVKRDAVQCRIGSIREQADKRENRLVELTLDILASLGH